MEDTAPKPNLVCVKSPKSLEFPVDEIVTYSILLITVGVSPPANIPRVGDEQPLNTPIVVLKIPKLIEFPVEEIVT